MTILNAGQKVYIRTVTHHQVGEIVAIETVGQQNFVVLKNASWIADSGRWADALKLGFGSDAEIEPCPGTILVNLGSVIDIFAWEHDLPEKQQ